MRARRMLAGATVALVAALVALLAAPTAVFAAGPYPPPSDLVGKVTPNRVELGACTIFSGSGFEPNVEIVITDNDKPRGKTRTNSKGEFSYEVCFGLSDKPGKHVLRATGLARDANGALVMRSVTATVTVIGVSQTDPAPTDEPGGVPPAARPDDLAFSGLPALVLAAAGTALVAAGSFLLLATERRHRQRRRLA